MGIGLLLGARLARKRRFRQHAWCQSAIVLLNLAVVVAMMIPSFRVHVLPRIPAKLGKAYYALATTHGAFGAVTELAGLYILLSACTSVLPGKLRITKYKVWMRSVLVLWWVVLLLGLATYTRRYVPHLFRKIVLCRAFQRREIEERPDLPAFLFERLSSTQSSTIGDATRAGG
jgi:uncharacterized membrane protein YozB (DUF420 family)